MKPLFSNTPLNNHNTPSYTTFMSLTALIAMWKTFSEPSNYGSGWFFFFFGFFLIIKANEKMMEIENVKLACLQPP